MSILDHGRMVSVMVKDSKRAKHFPTKATSRMMKNKEREYYYST